MFALNVVRFISLRNNCFYLYSKVIIRNYSGICKISQNVPKSIDSKYRFGSLNIFFSSESILTKVLFSTNSPNESKNGKTEKALSKRRRIISSSSSSGEENGTQNVKQKSE